MNSGPRPLRVVTLLLCAACIQTAPGQDRIVLSPDGWFRTASGRIYYPLGGFHGNVLPISRLQLTPDERARVAPHIWSAQKTDDQGHIDLWDASDAMLDQWFRQLAQDGVTAIRLFARARVGNDVLDLCGKLNPALQQVFHRTFAAARPYGIRFLLQILPEPGSMCYINSRTVEARALPRYSPAELSHLTPAQRRFLVDRKRVTLKELFTDPDVIACQKQYLAQALDWIATEPQVFALEIYNEQGWTRTAWNGKSDYTFTFPMEDDEIRWTAAIVQTIKKRLPDMPVTLSHPGFGVTGYDPVKWSRGAGVDFYSSHMYAGLCGEGESIDFSAATAAEARVIAAAVLNFSGEWGVFNSPVPMDVKRLSHRDAIWLSLLAGQPGFLQWTSEFPDEYRWPAWVIRSLPDTFSPQPPPIAVEIGAAYQTFQTNTRYPLFIPGQLFPAFPFNRQKQSDPNLQQILRAYQHSLESGIPISFAMGRSGAISLDRFMTIDPARWKLPIRASGGYDATWMKDANSRFWVAYFRHRKVQGFGKHYVGIPAEAPLEIHLDLPHGRYQARLIDLTADKLEIRQVSAHEVMHVSDRTASDFALVVVGI